MLTTATTRAAAARTPHCPPRRTLPERTIAGLVLITIALSFASTVAGHPDVEGKATSGVRRAASQLQRKEKCSSAAMLAAQHIATIARRAIEQGPCRQS